MIRVKFAQYGSGVGVEVTCLKDEAQEALNLYADLTAAIKEANLEGFRPPKSTKAKDMVAALAEYRAKR